MPAITSRSLARSTERGGIIFKLLFFLSLFVVIFILYLIQGPLLRAWGEWWIVDEAPQQVQAIVVLSGDSVFGERLRHAVELHRRGWAQRLVLSGRAIRTNFSEAELMEREALSLGMHRDALLVLRHSAASTLEEALALRRFLAENKIRSILVVTSNFHTRRARTIFRRVFRKFGTLVFVSASPDVRFDPRRWWEQRSGRKMMLYELLKTLNTWWELRSVPPPASVVGVLPRPVQSISLRMVRKNGS